MNAVDVVAKDEPFTPRILNMNITNHFLKFESCVNHASRQSTVTFRFCPRSGDDACGSCDKDYNEFVIGINDYLDYTVEYRREEQDLMCKTCKENCQGFIESQSGADGDSRRRRHLWLDSGDDCEICTDLCRRIEDMESNFYLDATDYIKCQLIHKDSNGSGDLYAGPMCVSEYNKIKIGVYKDKDCVDLDTSKDVENYLKDENGNPFRLSHALLHTVYGEDYACIDCMEENEGDAVEVKEVCSNLYSILEKQESKWN